MQSHLFLLQKSHRRGCIVLSKSLSHCVIITVYSLSLTRQSLRGSNIFIFRASGLTECLTHEDSLTADLLNARARIGMNELHILCLPFILLSLLEFLLVSPRIIQEILVICSHMYIEKWLHSTAFFFFHLGSLLFASMFLKFV